MRTTVTLDPDVAAKIKAEMKRTGKSFKEVLNALVRKGTTVVPAEPRKPFKVRPIASGEKPGFAWDNISELLGQLDQLDRKR